MRLHYKLLIFLNTARESGKSYMINHVVYFGLKLPDFICEVNYFRASDIPVIDIKKVCITTGGEIKFQNIYTLNKVFHIFQKIIWKL